MVFEYSINGEVFNDLFMLIDGIYPQLSRFVQDILVLLTNSDHTFISWQKSKRKDVAHGFGVLKI